MEITSDIMLRGTAWNEAIDKLSDIFATRTNYSIFLFCVAIGIMYDKRVEKPIENGEEIRTVPRNVIQNNDNGKLDFMFQAAILSSRTIELSEEQRLAIAFGEEKIEPSKTGFLVEFANYGVTELVKLIGNSSIESMDNIRDFLVSTLEGRNFDIDTLSDDILLEE
jgi:hypothetical protein